MGADPVLVGDGSESRVIGDISRIPYRHGRDRDGGGGRADSEEKGGG